MDQGGVSFSRNLRQIGDRHAVQEHCPVVVVLRLVDGCVSCAVDDDIDLLGIADDPECFDVGDVQENRFYTGKRRDIGEYVPVPSSSGNFTQFAAELTVCSGDKDVHISKNSHKNKEAQKF